jgi:hypothetical protein
VRRAAKVDNNQAEIVKAFRDIGASVQILSAVGKGCPDTIVGFRGKNIFVEIKDGSKVASRQQLTGVQVAWHGKWAGQVCVANSIEDAICKVIEATHG